MPSVSKTTGYAAAFASLGLLTWTIARRRDWLNLAEKVVVITGGSRGLGLQLAREFGACGAKVVICSRDEAELERAKSDLTQRGIVTQALPCDVSDQQQCEKLIQETVRVAGSVDVLVNNAGLIQVGPLSAMTISDFKQAMGIMFWGPLYTTLAALPALRKSGEGRIVNITSIGGKISVPHLLPYCCAKFAAVALSEGLRAELAPAGIRVTTVVPGLMRTGSDLQALFKGDRAREYAWFSLAASSPLISISAPRAARAIVRAASRGEAECILSIPAAVAARIHGISPALTSALSTSINRVLPDAVPGEGGASTGAEARDKLNSFLVNAANLAGRRAAESLNQIA